MKIQCDCGSKFAFDVTPDMATRPIQFACPSCAKDLSAQLTMLVRQQLGVSAPPPPPPRVGGAAPVATLLPSTPVASAPVGGPPPVEIAPPPPSRPVVPPSSAPAPAPQIKITVPTTPTPAPVSAIAPPPPPSAPAPVRIVVPPAPAPAPPVEPRVVSTSAPAAVTAPVVRIHRSEQPKAEASPDVVDKRFCTKHAGQRITEECVVCGKGICPVCMRLFGYLCSPHCKEKAALQGIDVPVYEGQRDVAEAKQWQKTGLIFKLSGAAIVLLLGLWFWWEWFATRPSPMFAVRFEDTPAESGSSALIHDGQLVFIHGEKLARYDVKSKKQVWLRSIVDHEKIAKEAAAEVKRLIVEKDRIEGVNPDADIRVPGVEKLTQDWIESEQYGLELYVHDKNIWVVGDDSLTRYDWDTGAPGKSIPFEGTLEDAKAKGPELVFNEYGDEGEEVTRRFNLDTGELSTDKKNTTAAITPAPATNEVAIAKPPPKPELTVPPGQLDPRQLAAKLSGASLPAKVAAPATLSNLRNQQRIQNELNSMDADFRPARDEDDAPDYREYTSRERSVHGEVFLTEKLVEHKVIVHDAMKAKPKKSALDGNVNVTQLTEVANDILNDMQRDAGLDKVTEDVSRYAVKVRDTSTTEADAWKGEIIGSPDIFPLKTVNVLCGGKMVIVLDKSNKKKWEATLSHNVSHYGASLDEDDAPEGLGPVVERGDTLYVFDAGVLSAFDIATGTARWRLPSVGVSGLFFDGEGGLYVNTTTATLDKLKYSRQININDDTHDILLKLEEKTGKELWKAELGGSLSYMKGKYIYMMSSYRSDDDGDSGLGISTPSYLRIKRINPKSGRIMWEHFQERGPLDVKFDGNRIQLVFKKEVQVLSYW